jgi:putative NADH-flavin reductase
MKLTVFGPTGGTGEQIIRLALAAGHEVTAVARRPDAVALTHQSLRIVPGDVLDPDWPGKGIDGADAVLSALGTHNLRQPTTVYSAGTAAVLKAMAAAGVRRFIAISATPAGPDDAKTEFDRRVAHPIVSLFFGGGYADMRRMEHLVAESQAEWTIFRPPRLTNGPLTGSYRTAVGTPLPRARQVARADLAAAMLAATGDPALIRHAVTIAA